MNELKPSLDKETHRKLAIDLFNYTWDLIEKSDRSEADDEEMINAAHTSRFHWGIAGIPLNFARGEWQISRVYSLVGRAEPALYHAKKSLEHCLSNNFSAFDLGFAYEALARGYAVEGNSQQRDENISLARQAAENVEKDGDKVWLLKNVESVETLTLPKWE